VNPNSVLIPVTRVNGVTTVLTQPQGGRFPGTAALINLVGYTPEQMYAGFKAVRMSFPSAARRGRWDRSTEEDRKKKEAKALKEINMVWKQAKLYAKLDSANQVEKLKYNPELAALAPAAIGKATLLIEVHRAADIESAIKWVEANKVKAIFTGVAEGWRVADKIAAAKIPVITGPVLSTPNRSSDKYDTPYRNAGVMQKAGVKVALRTNESENVRNLPYNAGFAATYGMGKEEALKAVTIVPAEMFGLADQIGSLEVGKVATLFITNGDPFETKTQVQHLFINGYNVPLESRHTYLYDEFLKRD
jgi:imidazolonepropionase-like amidohydrolase